MPKRKCSDINQNVGRRLKQYRVACGLTQEQVAAVLNINRTTYTKYETGVSEPSHELLRQIVEIYGTDFNSILAERGSFEHDVFDMKMPMYNLTRDEQQLIAFYRTMDDIEKRQVDEVLNSIVEERNRRLIGYPDAQK
ncbi:MAG: helix-turn-helix domain-containing protein [Ruminococcus sp.]|nr:helix-turn-helix domain-containing protein [Ruminococcus sp.]